MTSAIEFAPELKDREHVLGELLRRLMHHPPQFDPPAGPPRFFIGFVPAATPVKLPVPPSGQIIAVILRGERNMQLFLDVDLIPQEVVDFYTEALGAEGWHVMEDSPMGRGFRPGPNGDVKSVFYCRGPAGPSVNLTAWKVADAQSDVRLRFEADADPMCDPKARQGFFIAAGLGSLIPRLIAPSGTWKSAGSGGGGSGHWLTSAVLETEMSSADLMAHFASQLEQSSWNRLGQVELSHTLITHWEFTDPAGTELTGFLDVRVPKTHPKTRHVNLFVIKQGTPPSPYVEAA